MTAELFYRNEACRNHSTSTGEPIRPNAFAPRCIVVLLEAASQEALLEEMLGSGRVPTDPVRLNVTYATTRSAAPDYEVAAS